MKKYFSFIIFFLAGCLSALSQNNFRLSLVIKDSVDLHPLANVSCRAISVTNKIHTFGISDKNGGVALTVNQTDTIVLSLIGYETIRSCAKVFKADKANTILMAEKAYEIREVAIKAEPIKSKNDTITYLAKAFTKQGDVHLEDILNNLPGVKVSDNGYISYQGKSINKFYIEGKDLLGNNYNQATRNLSADAIAAIEILENHQPTKMLRGKQFSDKAAINIKIDNRYKSRLFGEVEAGIGGRPTIWDNRIFLSRVSKDDQMLFTGKMNNVGTNLSSETIEHADISDTDAYEPLPSALISSSSKMESIDQSRYLKNISYSGGLNYLTSFSDDATLRLNVLTYSDHSTYSNYTRTLYRGEPEIGIVQQKVLPQKEFSVQPILKYELNADNIFVSDELKFSVSRYSSLGSILSNTIMVGESHKSRPTYLQNYFSTSFPVGHQFLQVKSLVRYFDRTESLGVTSDTVAYDNISERYSSRSFVTKNIASTSLPLLGNSLRLTLRHIFRSSDYDYNGVVTSKLSKLRFAPAYMLSYGLNSYISFALPVTILNTRNNISDINIGSRDKINIEPELSLSHNFSDSWRSYLTASRSNDVYSPTFLSSQQLRTSYRTAYWLELVEQYLVEHDRVNLLLAYRNLESMVFANINVSYSYDQNECYSDYWHNEALTIVQLIKGKNHRNNFMVNASLDKNIPDAGVSIKSSANYNSTSYLMVQNGVFTYNNSNSVGANLRLEYQKMKWMRVNAGIQGSLFWEKNEFVNSDKYRQLDINGSMFLFPAKSLEFKFSVNSQFNEIQKSQFKNFTLFDAHAKYNINKFLQLSLTATNLLNASQYIIAQDSGIDFYYYDLPLRGREVLVKLAIRL